MVNRLFGKDVLECCKLNKVLGKGCDVIVNSYNQNVCFTTAAISVYAVQAEEERDALVKRLSQLETDTATAKTSLEENTVKLQEWGEQKEKV